MLNCDDMKETLKQRLTSITLCIMAMVSILSIVSAVKNAAVITNSAQGRKLPIYCVKKEEPKISISFDAAWGNIILC